MSEEVKRSKAKKLDKEPEYFLINEEVIAVKPMVIKKAREFRGEIKGIISQAVDSYNQEDWVQIIELVDELLGDKLIQLAMKLSDDLKELGRDWIEENMTESQIKDILAEGIKMNYPWLAEMIEMGKFGRMVQEVENQTKNQKK